MARLHDPGDREAVKRRVQRLTPEAQRRWGKMGVAQMLWHVNQAMSTALGYVKRDPVPARLPKPLMKFLVLNMPWMKGAPTLPQWRATEPRDFTVERDRCLRLIDEMASRSLDEPIEDPNLGRMTGVEVSRLHAKHLDHHLKQFGV